MQTAENKACRNKVGQMQPTGYNVYCLKNTKLGKCYSHDIYCFRKQNWTNANGRIQCILLIDTKWGKCY